MSANLNCHVLVVDDSPILRTAIKKVVKLAGVPEDRIFEAGNGVEALEVLETVWPVMDGEQFARELRNRPDLKDVAVVVVSTEANRERLERMRELGVEHTLRKPFEPEALCRLISDILGVKPS
jgi:CheY-like chemotaxis protein